MPPLNHPLPIAATAWRWLDRTLGTALAAALAMALVTAWPGDARAQRAEGDGQARSEQRVLGEFTGVHTRQLMVVVRQGPAPGVTVQADANLLPLLETRVEDGAHGRTLHVRWKPGVSIKPVTPPRIMVQVPAPDRLMVEGSGDIVGEALKLPRLQARVTGSGDIRLNGVAVDELALEVTGSGDIGAHGRTGRLQVRISGSGDVKTDALQADDVAVSIVGSGDASVQAQRSLAVSISGSGNVVHSGAASAQTTVNGSGSVRRR